MTNNSSYYTMVHHIRKKRGLNGICLEQGCGKTVDSSKRCIEHTKEYEKIKKLKKRERFKEKHGFDKG